MLISSEFFDQLSSSYKKVIEELDADLAKLQVEDSITARRYQQQIIESFFAKYLMPKEYWQFYEFFFENEHVTKDYAIKKEKRKWKAFQQFYWNKDFGPLKSPQKTYYFYPKLLDFHGEQWGEAVTCNEKTDFSYPHSFLKECFQHYENRATKHPSKTQISQYEKMKKLYQKIKSSEGNLEEWLQNLLELNDHEFVCHNIEHRLGANLLDTNLWKLYINYLEKTDTKKMLEIYSKYCRFFLDDFEMKEEYKAKVQKYGPSFVHWSNIFDFETKAANIKNSLFDAPKEVNDYSDDDEIYKPLSINKKLLKNFYKNYQNQNFPFQKPFIEYILVNGNYEVWRKLHQSCKNFFAKKPVPICYRLRIKLNDTFFDQETLIQKYDEKDTYLKNTWIATSFSCKFSHNVLTKLVSKIIPRLYKCDAKYIAISKELLTFDELKFLIGSGNVVKLELPKVGIKHENGEFVDLENIMEFLPNIEQLQLSNIKFNKNTANILANQKFYSKINTIKIMNIFGEPFDTTEFLNFCQKNRDDRFFLRMEFKHSQRGFSLEFSINFQKLMQDSFDINKTHIGIILTPM